MSSRSRKRRHYSTELLVNRGQTVDEIRRQFLSATASQHPAPAKLPIPVANPRPDNFELVPTAAGKIA